MARMISLCFVILIPLSGSFYLPLIRSKQRYHPSSHQHQPLARTCTFRSGKATLTATTDSHRTSAAACINEALGQNRNLNELSRSELQGLCKKLNIRAVGRTDELVSRLSEARDHDVLGTAGAILDDSSSSSRTSRLSARDILPGLEIDGANDGDVEQQLGGDVEARKVRTSLGLSFMIHRVRDRSRIL